MSAGHLYPREDPILEALQQHAAPVAAEALRIGPAGDAREPLGGGAYREIARSWCRQAGVELDAGREETLRVVCDVHAELQQRHADFSLPDRSLSRLEDAIELIIAAQRNGALITPHEALERSLTRLPPESRAWLERILTNTT